jgi:hypothetical protein
MDAFSLILIKVFRVFALLIPCEIIYLLAKRIGYIENRNLFRLGVGLFISSVIGTTYLDLVEKEMGFKQAEILKLVVFLVFCIGLALLYIYLLRLQEYKLESKRESFILPIVALSSIWIIGLSLLVYKFNEKYFLGSLNLGILLMSYFLVIFIFFELSRVYRHLTPFYFLFYFPCFAAFISCSTIIFLDMSFYLGFVKNFPFLQRTSLWILSFASELPPLIPALLFYLNMKKEVSVYPKGKADFEKDILTFLFHMEELIGGVAFTIFELGIKEYNKKTRKNISLTEYYDILGLENKDLSKFIEFILRKFSQAVGKDCVKRSFHPDQKKMLWIFRKL